MNSALFLEEVLKGQYLKKADGVVHSPSTGLSESYMSGQYTLRRYGASITV